MNLTEYRRRTQAPPLIDAPVQDIVKLSQDIVQLARGYSPQHQRRWLVLSPEMRAAIEIARAIRTGDEGRARELTEAFVGRPLDKLLTELYGAETWTELTDWENGILPLFVAFLRYHSDRMRSEPEEWYKKRAKYVFRMLKKPDGWHLMQSQKGYGKNRAERLERLRRELPGAVMAAELEGYFGSYIVSGAEARIIEENRLQEQLLREQRRKREQKQRARARLHADKSDEPSPDDTPLDDPLELPEIAPLDDLPEVREFFEDATALAPYRAAESALCVKQLIERADLNDKERLTLDLHLQQLSSREIARPSWRH